LRAGGSPGSRPLREAVAFARSPSNAEAHEDLGSPLPPRYAEIYGPGVKFSVYAPTVTDYTLSQADPVAHSYGSQQALSRPLALAAD
jgi:hypothetical protein